jgi:two-component system CheB/CheR fusion protein
MEQLERCHPRVALLDIGLPEIDGYQLAAMMREQPQGRAMKLVALTGYGRENDRVRALEAGFDEHLVKPVDLETLKQVLARLMV